MRVIAGQWRGRPLIAPAGDATRPTADRTREALFSMLVSRIGSFEGLAVGDFFAGSGALGLEALSRGAASCLFVEQDRAAVTALKSNAEKLGVRADVRQTSVLSLGPALAPLDIVFMDPPYGTGAAGVALDKLGRLGWFAQGCWISVETAKAEVIDCDGFTVDVSRAIGKARITLLTPGINLSVD